jgi:heme exporter protein A
VFSGADAGRVLSDVRYIDNSGGSRYTSKTAAEPILKRRLFRPGDMRLVADNLSIDRGGRRIVDGLSFALAAGEALVVTGRNGAGKSTLLRAVAGLLPLAGGRIAWLGGGPSDDGVPLAAEAHYVGHADALKAALTAAENLTFWQAMLGGSARAGAMPPKAALAQLGLRHVADLPVRYLSAGQKRRVALARLLVVARPLWLVDEPTATLDADTRQRFAEILLAHLAEGGLVLAATHVPLGLIQASELRLGAAA